MNREQAKAALAAGAKLTHPYFCYEDPANNGWIEQEGQIYYFEDGTANAIQLFWDLRNSEVWGQYWKLYRDPKREKEFKELKIEGSAQFSACGQYREMLCRSWYFPTHAQDLKDHIVFIGLNPSTADAYEDDPTIRRVVRFAWDWGYNGVVMMNLHAYITPYPYMLSYSNHIMQAENFKRIEKIGEGRTVVFAWGNFEEAREAAGKVVAMFPNAKCLGHNKNGSPKHPLYVPSYTRLVDYQPKPAGQ